MAHYGLDGFRYFLLAEGPIAGQMPTSRRARVQEVYGTDLVNTLGNSLSRTAMVNKYYEGGIVPSGVETGEGERMAFPGFDWPHLDEGAADEVARCVDNMELPRAPPPRSRSW